MPKYHALLKKPITPQAAPQLIQSCVSMLTQMGIQVEKQHAGPLASIVFESDLSARELQDRLKDVVKVVGEIQPVSLIRPMGVKAAPKGFHTLTRTAFPKMGFDKVWTDPLYDEGKSLIFGIIDTGIGDPFVDLYFGNRIIDRFCANPAWQLQQKMFHGRVCAAVIGRSIQETDQGIFRGAFPQIRILDAQALDGNGYGDTETVHACFVWMLSHNPLPHGITLSLGGPHDPVLDADVAQAIEMGIAVSCAAGNEGTSPNDPNNWPDLACDGTMACPADAIDNMSVGATNGGHEDEDGIEYFQAFTSRNPPKSRTDGSKQEHNVCACGVRIWVGLGEGAWTGTSLGEPFSFAALLWAILILMLKVPSLSPKARYFLARKCVQDTAHNLGYKGGGKYTDGQAYCLQGYGRVEADDAGEAAKQAGPSEPSQISKVEFYVDNTLIGQATTQTGDVFTYPQVVPDGDHLFQGKVFAEGLDPVMTEVVHFKVVKVTPTKKIVTSVKSPTDGQEFPSGYTIPFQVNAKVVQES